MSFFLMNRSSSWSLAMRSCKGLLWKWVQKGLFIALKSPHELEYTALVRVPASFHMAVIYLGGACLFGSKSIIQEGHKVIPADLLYVIHLFSFCQPVFVWGCVYCNRLASVIDLHQFICK